MADAEKTPAYTQTEGGGGNQPSAGTRADTPTSPSEAASPTAAETPLPGSNTPAGKYIINYFKWIVRVVGFLMIVSGVVIVFGFLSASNATASRNKVRKICKSMPSQAEQDACFELYGPALRTGEKAVTNSWVVVGCTVGLVCLMALGLIMLRSRRNTLLSKAVTNKAI